MSTTQEPTADQPVSEVPAEDPNGPEPTAAPSDESALARLEAADAGSSPGGLEVTSTGGSNAGVAGALAAAPT